MKEGIAFLSGFISFLVFILLFSWLMCSYGCMDPPRQAMSDQSSKKAVDEYMKQRPCPCQPKKE